MLQHIKKITLGRYLLAAVLAATLCANADDDWDYGPLLDRFKLTLDIGERTEVLGPLFYSETNETTETIAVPPLFSHVKYESVDADEFDLLYPILTYDRFGKEYRWQLFQLLSLSGGQNQEQVTKTRFTIFPVYFQQRSADSNQNYTALIPIYGTLKNRLFRDEVHFVMLPVYVQSRKRDVVTDNYVYPFFHLRHGNELFGWQFWPLVGNEHKGITYKTNGFGDVETIGGHKKFFALWPIYFNQTTGIGTDNPAKTVAVLPFFDVMRSPLRDYTSVIWPFFNYADDREKKYHEWDGPWPFVAIARGEGKTTTRVFPLFSRSHNDTVQSDFYLWPLYKYRRVHSGALDHHRTRILFYLFQDVGDLNTETRESRGWTGLWPLFMHQKNFDGSTRLQLLAPLEPILPNNKSIERNYSPLWSVWRSQKNATNGNASQSFLWNLYRHESVGERRKCSLLFGLFQYQSTAGAGKRVKLFYIPVINSGHRESPAEKRNEPRNQTQ